MITNKISAYWKACQLLKIGCLLTSSLILMQPVVARQPRTTDDKLPAQLDKLMTAYTAAGLFNGSVLISKEGKALLAKGYGYSNLASRTANTTNTKFPIYSITKSMTAALVLQLAEKKLLALDERLSRFYPAFPAADSIRISHLLTHTSGLYPYNNDYSMPTGSEDAIVGFLSTRALQFPPGSQWQYCNTGYYLLGFIIEKLTGMSYGDALANRLFKPLKMSNSGLDFRALRAPEKATGYSFLISDSGKEARLYPHEELRSAGGVWSTVGDLLKFHDGMQSNCILSSTSSQQAYSAYQKKYGYGWFIDSADGRQVVSHSGGAAGFRSLLVRIPATNTCIALLANAENIDLAVIKADIMQVLSGKPYQVPYSIEVDSTRLSAIAGCYRLEQDRTLYIVKVRNRLIAQISGQQRVLLLSDSSGHFKVAGSDGYLEFTGVQSGACDSVALFRRGRKHVGVRIDPYWGIIGSALPGGWSGPDIPLLPVSGEPGTWKATNVGLVDGAFKFRFNRDWTINLGTAFDSNVLEADGEDIITRAGTYTIVLNLQSPANPKFTMTKEAL